MSTTPNEEQSIHADLVREWAELESQVAGPQARIEEIKKFLRVLDLGTHELAGYRVSVSPNRRLDPKKFAEKYPVLKHPEFYKTAPDSTKIAKELSGPDLREVSTFGDPRISLK